MFKTGRDDGLNVNVNISNEKRILCLLSYSLALQGGQACLQLTP